MNKKGFLGFILGGVALVLFLLITLSLANQYTNEKIEYNTYKPFCDERPTFCYCEMGRCEFKLGCDLDSETSEDIKDLCNLAKELNDKEMIFKAGCK